MTEDPKQLQVFPDRLHLRRVDPEKNMRRFYLMSVQRDLFGGAQLVREWGRIGSSGKIKTSFHADEGQAVDALAATFKVKSKRGYKLKQGDE
jgi:predicted DNA-binding WGR domain protein